MNMKWANEREKAESNVGLLLLKIQFYGKKRNGPCMRVCVFWCTRAIK